MSTTSTPNRQQRSVEQESNLQTSMVIGTDWVRIMMFNATFNNILVISWWSVLLVGGNWSTLRKPPTCRMSLTNFII